MSISFLKPVVTPVTALATSARARPCSAACSSFWRTACSSPFFCSMVIPRGSLIFSFPLGPCTSTESEARATFTPAGTAIGFLPIRDMKNSFWFLPNLAQHFAAHMRLARGAAGHHALGRGHDADAHAADHWPNLGRAEIAPAARLRHAAQVGDHAALVRRVLEEEAQRLARLVFLDQLVGGDVALFLEDAGDFHLQLRGGYIDARVASFRRVANPCQQIGNGIGLHILLRSAPRSALATSWT